MNNKDRLADLMHSAFKRLIGDRQVYSNPNLWSLIADEVLNEIQEDSSSSSSYELCHSEGPGSRGTKIKINYEAREIVITY